MPAARPSKAVIDNALMAVKDSGYSMTVVTVGSDGPLRIEVKQEGEPTKPVEEQTGKPPKKWGQKFHED